MRVPTGKIPAQPLTFMWERHREIMRRLVAGERQIDVCRSIGMSQTRMSIITNSPMFQAHMAELSASANKNAADIQGRITRLAPDSMSILESAIQDKEAGLSPIQKVKTAQDVLAMAGHGPIQKHMGRTEIYDEAKIEEIKERARVKNARVINAEPVR